MKALREHILKYRLSMDAIYALPYVIENQEARLPSCHTSTRYAKQNQQREEVQICLTKNLCRLYFVTSRKSACYIELVTIFRWLEAYFLDVPDICNRG